MNKKNLLRVSVITLVIGLAVLAIAYFFFHFVGDEGIREWQPEAGKPFVTDMIGQLGARPYARGCGRKYVFSLRAFGAFGKFYTPQAPFRFSKIFP